MYIRSAAVPLLLWLLLGLWLWSGKLERIWLTVNTSSNLLPSTASTLKVSERLGKLKWLNHNAFLLLVISDLSVSRQWEVLSQRVSIKSVVGHDAAKIWVSNEEDTEQIVDLTLVPVGTVVESCDRWDWLGLVRVGLDSYPGVVAHREQVINDLESLVAAWKVDSGDIGDGGELGSCVIP